MDLLQETAPLFAAMAFLAAASGFFSCSEAALFSVRPDQLRRLGREGRRSRAVVELLSDPERLLTAILFWNLMINIAYFALSSVVSIQFQKDGRPAEAGVVAVGAVLAIILFSEMLPKTIGVTGPRSVSTLVSLPLAASVRLLDPVAPVFGTVMRALKRVFLPGFQPEPYLQVQDLERAISLSTADQELAALEHSALQEIVQLSEQTAEELMRPRRHYQQFAPPVHLDDLGGRLTRSGYVLVSEPDSDEIARAIPVKHLWSVPRQHLEEFAVDVVYVPWCASVAVVFGELQRQRSEVAAVINEHGETVGIVTLEDLLETIFLSDSTRSGRLLERTAIQPLWEGGWRVTGMTGIRRLARELGLETPDTKSTTVGGVLQEELQRIPEEGDRVSWGQVEFHVVEVTDDGTLLVEMTLTGLLEDGV
ncbi:MAG: CNNM domain-containing protein [Planctomycetota bacterium]